VRSLRLKTGALNPAGFSPGARPTDKVKMMPFTMSARVIQKRILNGQGMIRFNANDVLNTLTLHSQTSGINGVSAFNPRASDTRYVGLSFTYRFGKTANARNGMISAAPRMKKGGSIKSC
jgi:hypothetical protein